jgi:tripartite-type tricarboxylate transporter receptor subunit TctC
MRNFLRYAIAAVVAAVSLHALPSLAQSWPQRTVKFILPLGPGSGVDLSARLLAERLTAMWGQSVVVENRPGGDGVIAVNAVLSAREDHTLLYSPASSFVAHPYLLEKMTYDPRDLVPVARVSNTVVSIAVPASLKVASLKELVAMVREQPGKMNWTSATGVTDLVIAGYLKGAGLDMVRVAYKDPASAVNDLVEGRIQFYSSAYAIVRAQAQAGRLRVLAVQTRGRAPALPELPTVAEAGFPELNFDGLVGLLTVRGGGLTATARDRIAADVKTVLGDPTISGRLTATGQIVSPGTPAEFSAAIDEQSKHLAAVVKVLGLKPAQ